MTIFDSKRRTLCGTALALVVATASGQSPRLHADPFDTLELRALVGDSMPSTNQLLETLRGQYARLLIVSESLPLSRQGIYVTIGAAALERALAAHLEVPLLALNVSNEQYRDLISASVANRRRAPLTAIFAEPSVVQQFQLIRVIFRRELTVGVLLSDRTAHLEAQLRQTAGAASLQIEIQHIEPGDNVVRAIGRMRSSSVLLAIPDRSIFTAENLRTIIESCYRRSLPIIGFSASLVRAGTLATVYSTPTDTIAQASLLLEQLAAGRVPPPQYPAYWRVAVNDYVARSLNVPIDDNVRNFGNAPR